MTYCGKIKKFDQSLCDKYDIPAREIVKKRLGEENICDNPDIYAEDMIITNESCKYKFLELQVCVSWTGEKYPYNLPFIYERKFSFSDKTLFLVLNRYMTRGLIFNRASVIDKPRRLKKYSRYFVYEVPWHRVLPIQIDTFDMETLEIYH